MKQLQIKVDKDNVSLVHPLPQITTGEYRVTLVSFDFSEEWRDLEIKARFNDYEETVVNNSCYLPMIEKSGVLIIKVFGYQETVVNGETVKELVYSPVPAKLKVELGSYDGTAGGQSPTPPPDQFADFMTKLKLWTGYSAFFNSLEDVPAEIQSEFESVDISELTTAQVEEKIEILNKMLASESGNDKNYTHTQSQSSNTWVIAHNLGKYPSVTVINSAGDEVVGDVKYDSKNQVTVTFKGAFKGTAILN